MPDIKAAQVMCSSDEEHILRRLGAAVVVQWDELPGDVHALLLEQAVQVSGAPGSSDKADIEQFIRARRQDA